MTKNKMIDEIYYLGYRLHELRDTSEQIIKQMVERRKAILRTQQEGDEQIGKYEAELQKSNINLENCRQHYMTVQEEKTNLESHFVMLQRDSNAIKAMYDALQNEIQTQNEKYNSLSSKYTQVCSVQPADQTQQNDLRAQLSSCAEKLFTTEQILVNLQQDKAQIQQELQNNKGEQDEVLEELRAFDRTQRHLEDRIASMN